MILTKGFSQISDFGSAEFVPEPQSQDAAFNKLHGWRGTQPWVLPVSIISPA